MYNSALRLPDPKTSSRASSVHRLLSHLEKGSGLLFGEKVLPHSIHGLALKTSGSTGKPKIAILPYRALLASALSVNAFLGIDQSDRYLLSLPLNHVSGIGIVLRCYLAGAELLIPEDRHEIPKETTRLSFVPTQLRRLKADLPHLKTILLGGQHLPEKLIRESSYPLVLSYGSTEMGSTITAHKYDGTYSLGHPLSGREIKVDESGEIWVKGETLFWGYQNQPHEGWFPTKDLGTYTEKGLTILGRKDRMFISGGENIHPEEIERALLSLDEIEDAIIKVIPDDEYGKRPVAYIKPFTQALKEKLLDKLEKHKIPDHFYPLERLSDDSLSQLL